VKNKGVMHKICTAVWIGQWEINEKFSNANTGPTEYRGTSACRHLHKTILFAVSKADLPLRNCSFNIQICLNWNMTSLCSGMWGYLFDLRWVTNVETT
jgi:hypothetical protein